MVEKGCKLSKREFRGKNRSEMFREENTRKWQRTSFQKSFVKPKNDCRKLKRPQERAASIVKAFVNERMEGPRITRQQNMEKEQSRFMAESRKRLQNSRKNRRMPKKGVVGFRKVDREPKGLQEEKRKLQNIQEKAARKHLQTIEEKN